LYEPAESHSSGKSSKEEGEEGVEESKEEEGLGPSGISNIEELKEEIVSGDKAGATGPEGRGLDIRRVSNWASNSSSGERKEIWRVLR